MKTAYEAMTTIKTSNDLLLETLSRFDENKLVLSDDDLSYEIFEELDSEYHSFLHEWTVDRLIEANMIPKSLRQRIVYLREKIRPVMEGKHEIGAYRNDPDWKKLRNEANDLTKEIKATNI